MTSRERFAALARGEPVDRLPFAPTVLEHSAAVIGRTPSECARDGRLLADAQVAAWRAYGHDLVTVGIDVYNLEAEALGCEVRFHEDRSVPGIVSHPLAVPSRLPDLTFDKARGRIGPTLAAAADVLARIGSDVPVSMGICGPFSIAVELRGYERLMEDCADDPDRARGLIDALLEHQCRYCDAILAEGLGVTVFESWATPPLLSPALYAAFAAPAETSLVRHLRNRGAATAPLVIGGDTTAVVDAILATGTTLLVADSSVDLGGFLRKASALDRTLRGNLDPKRLASSTPEHLLSLVDAMLDIAGGYRRFLVGTGVVSYDTPPENLRAIRRHLEARGMLGETGPGSL